MLGVCSKNTYLFYPSSSESEGHTCFQLFHKLKPGRVNAGSGISCFWKCRKYSCCRARGFQPDRFASTKREGFQSLHSLSCPEASQRSPFNMKWNKQHYCPRPSTNEIHKRVQRSLFPKLGNNSALPFAFLHQRTVELYLAVLGFSLQGTCIILLAY